MRFDPKSFYVAGNDVKWGTTLLELKSLLSGEYHIKSQFGGGWPNVHIECKEVYGFAATEFEADGPEFGLPVQRVRYKLAPASKDSQRPQVDFWVSKMINALGKPARESNNRRVNWSNPSSSVIYNAKWEIEDVTVSISVFGGVRQSSAGRLSAAGLYINWENILKAAEPTIDKNLKMEQKLELYGAEATDVDVFDLIEKQVPYYRRSSTPPYGPPSDERVRRAQRALYRSELMDTPSAIKDYLDDNEVAVWQIEDGARFVVSDKWDSVVINPNNHNRVNWENRLPAKGRGGMFFTIGHLTMVDKASSKCLTAVVEKIQELLPQPIKCHESYDC